MITFFIFWSIYVLVGILWLYFLVEDSWTTEWNQLGSIALVVIWPFHIIYYFWRKLIK
jgi:hypothetical protein